jgi:biopolymer transport protein ExbB/TolQ
MALIVLGTMCLLLLIGGLVLIATISDDWQGIRRVFEKNAEARKEKIRLKHELEMEKLRLEHEREQVYAGALTRAMTDDDYKELGLLDDDEKVENKGS